MKKHKKLLIFACCAAATAALALGCSGGATATVEFERGEYTVASGDRVCIDNADASYTLLSAPDGVTVSVDGTITIADGVENGTQVVLAAVVDGKITSTAVLTLTVPVSAPVVEFVSAAKYIVDGDRVSATAGGYGVSYSLKTAVDGVKVDPSSGRVTYTQIVADGTPFTVVATSHGASAEKDFLAAVGDLIVTENAVEFAEHGVGRDIEFVIDYGDMSGSGAVFAEQGVLGVELGRAAVSADGYSYDKATRTLTVKQAVIAALPAGENEIRILTAKNAAVATVKVATYLRTAEDLAAIGSSREALAGYYAMVNDIDLSDYLADKKGGWSPIGTYHDVTDGSATADAFRGTIDGLGHKISGLWMDWVQGSDKSESDDPEHTPEIDYDVAAKYFNAGFVGYMTADGVLRNIILESAEGESSYTCSYSGGLVGFNLGTVENCRVSVKVILENAEGGHRVAGGLVGRNQGDIRNCISLGWVTANNSYGALCGINEGVIESCYAVDDPSHNTDPALVNGDRPETLTLCGVGDGVNSAVYASATELIEKADISAWSGWTTDADGMPVLTVTQIR